MSNPLNIEIRYIEQHENKPMVDLCLTAQHTYLILDALYENALMLPEEAMHLAEYIENRLIDHDLPLNSLTFEAEQAHPEMNVWKQVTPLTPLELQER